MRPLALALLLAPCGCLSPNPAFDSASGSASPTTTSTTTTTGPVTTTSTGEPTTTEPGSATGTATTLAVTDSTSTSTSTASTSTTTESIFEPVTLRPYDPVNCIDGPFCASMDNPVPAAIEAFECFTAPVDPPLLLQRVGFQVRHSLGEPTATLDILPYDVVAHQPVLTPLATRNLGPVAEAMTYRSFDLDPPVLLDTPNFCVRIAGGGSTSTLVLNTDHASMTPGDAFVVIDNPAGVECDTPLTNLREWYDDPFAHYCLDIDIAPP